LSGGHRQIFVVDADGGLARPITSGEFEHQVPNWSADGEWIYFGSDQGGRYEVWKTSVKSGEMRQVTHDGGYFGQESADGNLVYFTKPKDEMATWTYSAPGLYSIGKNGDREKLVIPGIGWHWRATKDGVYFTDNRTKPKPTVKLFHSDTGRVETVASLDKEAWGNPGGIAISPEGKTFLYTQVDTQGRDLVLVKNGAW
jgi:Tol biopolymer transport system component